MKPTSAISVNHVSFSFGKHQVLEDVSIDFAKGSFSVLLGRNGCGKSTLFNLIAGLEHYKQGSIQILGKERNKLSFAQCAKLLGFMPQFHKPVFPFLVKDVVLTGRAAFSGYSPSKNDVLMVAQAIEEIGISHLMDRPYSELSGGEQQLVMMARVLVQHPPIIILDEPTNHLDIYYQTYVLQSLKKQCSKGMTVIAIMHDPNQALAYADQCYFMKNKKILALDDSRFPDQTSLLEDVYDVPFHTFQINGKNLVFPK